MAEHNNIGWIGEHLARKYLEAKGYTIRHINWKSGKKELDIIGITPDKNTLVIAEVKTRKSNQLQEPFEAVNDKKIKNIVQATDNYIKLYDISLPIRFDIITIVSDLSRHEIEHIEDAFLTPLW